jgi:hypothetical protein
VPFFGCTGVTPINGAFGTNYEPNFRLLNWVERAKLPAFDEYLDTHANGAPAPVAAPTAPAETMTTRTKPRHRPAVLRWLAAKLILTTKSRSRP